MPSLFFPVCLCRACCKHGLRFPVSGGQDLLEDSRTCFEQTIDWPSVIDFSLPVGSLDAAVVLLHTLSRRFVLLALCGSVSV